jgi:hypothetical protein
MCADKNPCGRHLTKHGIENRSVAAVLNGVNPDKHTVNVHELFTNFGAQIVAINRRLGVYSFCGKGSEQVGEPVIFGRGLRAGLVVARVENRKPFPSIIRHSFSALRVSFTLL